MTEVYPVNQCLNNESLLGKNVTVKGWVKTRRDSKAGISFVSLHDGSCFAPIQLVVPEQLANYKDEVLKL